MFKKIWYSILGTNSIEHNVLVDAKALIDTPEKWIKGIAKIGDSYCLKGAVIAATIHFQHFIVKVLLLTMTIQIPPMLM